MPSPLPKPLDRVPDAEDFAAWTEHEVTRFVAHAFLIAAKAQRDEWAAISWGSGVADEAQLTILRARADAYMAFLETPLERYVELAQGEKSPRPWEDRGRAAGTGPAARRLRARPKGD